MRLFTLGAFLFHSSLALHDPSTNTKSRDELIDNILVHEASLHEHSREELSEMDDETLHQLSDTFWLEDIVQMPTTIATVSGLDSEAREKLRHIVKVHSILHKSETMNRGTVTMASLKDKNSSELDTMHAEMQITLDEIMRMDEENEHSHMDLEQMMTGDPEKFTDIHNNFKIQSILKHPELEAFTENELRNYWTEEDVDILHQIVKLKESRHHEDYQFEGSDEEAYHDEL